MKSFLRYFFIIAIYFLGLFSFISCSSLFQAGYSDEISVFYFKDNYKVRQNDSVLIYWNFKNADSVKFPQMQLTLGGRDSLWYKSQSDTNLLIRAYNKYYNLDTTIKIKVIKSDHQTADERINSNAIIKTGAEKPSIDFSQPSIEITDFLNGILEKNIRHNFNKIKIARFDFDENKINLDLLLLDNFGNFVKGYDSSELQIDANLKYQDQTIPAILTFKGEKGLSAQKKLNFYIVIENSVAAYNSAQILSKIRSSLQNFYNTDLVSIYTYNQNLTKNIERVTPDEAFLQISQTMLNPKGTNSASSALIETLKNIIDDGKENEDNVIVQIAFSGDNSSITTSLTDAAKIAQFHKIPIYTIGIDTDIKSYQLLPLSEATGGKMYLIGSSEIDELSNILNEIYFSQKVGYKYQVTLKHLPKNVKKMALQISLTTPESTFLDDSVHIYLQSPEIEIPYQILAIFDYSQSEVKGEYLPKIKELANILKDNPNHIVEIQGFSNYEMNGNLDDDLSLSLKRAQNIRRILIEEGVNEEQIRATGRGNQYPLYSIPNKEWQLAFNRRAEIRWLDPSLLPYEVSAEIAQSEDEALNYVEKWEDKGFKSYYERISDPQSIKYKVKIWGFATIDEAKENIKRLQFIKPDIDFQIE